MIKQGDVSDKTSFNLPFIDSSSTTTETGLRDLPLELVRQIIGHVVSSSVVDSIRGLCAIKASSKYLKNVIEGDAPVREHYRKLMPLIQQFDRLTSQLATSHLKSDMLLLMGPKHLKKRVAFTLALGKADKSNELATLLGARLAALDPPDRGRFVEAATSHHKDKDKADAIAGLGAGLAALDAEQQEALVKAATGISDERHKSVAIAGLGAGLAALDAAQQEALVKAATGISDERHKSVAIAGLGASLAALESEQQEALVKAATGISSGWSKANAIAGLSPRLAALDGEQQQKVVEAVKQLPNELFVIAGVGAPGLIVLSSEQREALVTAAVEEPLEWEQHNKLMQLGPWLATLENGQQERLLTVMGDMFPDSPRVIAEPIIAMSAGLATLNPTLQQALVKLAADLEYGADKAEALASLGGGLKALEPLQKQVLVDAALNLSKGQQEDRGWCGATAIAGLAAGWAALTLKQQQELLDSALGLYKDKNKAMAITGIISGYLASMVPGDLR
jgi:hypothetical protein